MIISTYVWDYQSMPVKLRKFIQDKCYFFRDFCIETIWDFNFKDCLNVGIDFEGLKDLKTVNFIVNENRNNLKCKRVDLNLMIINRLDQKVNKLRIFKVSHNDFRWTISDYFDNKVQIRKWKLFKSEKVSIFLKNMVQN